MIELIITIVAFLVLVLLIAWTPFFRSYMSANKTKDSQTNFRDETNVRLYHEHKAEIEKDYQDGAIDQENYQYLLAELDKSLLQDIEGNKKEANREIVTSPISIVWPALISIFVLAFSFTLYTKTGAFEQIVSTPQVSQSSDAQVDNSAQQAIAQLDQLRKLVEENPEDGDAWYSIGQTLIGLGQFDQASAAFDRVINIEGEQAELVGAKAQASYYKNNQKINAATQALIDRALELDPLDPATNILLGMHNFMLQQYQQAIEHWQRVVDSARENTNIVALQDAINEAKNRLSMTGEEQTPVAAPVTASGPQLTINVSLSNDIQQRLSQEEDKIVFVYAIPTTGKRMPVAAKKMKASDLPITITLNDASAMMPAANLSSVDAVHLYAVVSKKGGVGIKPGDYKAERKGVDVKLSAPIELVIDQVVEQVVK